MSRGKDGGSFAAPGPDEQQAERGAETGAERLMAALAVFRELDPEMPIQYALSFLTLARHPGIAIGEIAARLGIAQSSASRNVAALGAWRSFSKPGLGLVEAKEDPRERRRKIVMLTPKGEALLAEIEAVMAGRARRGALPVTRFAGAAEAAPSARRRRNA